MLHTELGAIVYDVACPSATDCWAVGMSSKGSANVTLMEHWDGHSWTPVETPAPPASTFLVIYGLNSVTCVAADDCWAVGAYFQDDGGYPPLIEHWDGETWSLVSAPTNGDVDMPLAVTCTSTSDCWSVGYSFFMSDCPDTGCGHYSLAQHWNGHSWKTVAAPSPFTGTRVPSSAVLDAPQNFLRSVACASPTDCWAAGYGWDGARYRSLFAHWDGEHWSAAPGPQIEPAGTNMPVSIDCPSSSMCWAVGVSQPVSGSTGAAVPARQSLIARWNGTNWAMISAQTPSPVEERELGGVTCTSPSHCVAVGFRVDRVSGEHQTLVEQWDGAAWSSMVSPSPTSSAGMQLFGVDCASASSCVAAGAYPNPIDVPQPMALNLSDGHWQTTLTDFTGQPNTVLESIACPSPTDCWAVGYDTARTRPHIARFNGQEWKSVAAPTDPSVRAEGLYGVSCIAVSDCWAVGWSVSDGFHALIQHWDGTSWQTVEPPSRLLASSGTRTATDARAPASRSHPVAVEGVGVSSEWLRGISCASRNECWAVGVRKDQSVVRPLILRWDGSSWSVATNTAPGQADGYLSAVTCAVPGDCWAVGAHYGNVSSRTLIEHWDGSSWTESTMPDVAATSFDILNAVTCPSASDCWAVGSSASEGKISPLAVRWDGSAWSQVPSPRADGEANVLRGVSCLDPGHCWAVGRLGSRTLLQSWDGQAWTARTPPRFGESATLDAVVGITCLRSSAECHAVGYWGDVDELHGVAAHYSAPSVSPNG